jgi:hypothetical protein
LSLTRFHLFDDPFHLGRTERRSPLREEALIFFDQALALEVALPLVPVAVTLGYR